MLSLATKHNDPNVKLGWSERLGYGIGMFGISILNAMLGSFIYFTNVALLDAGIISTLIAVSKVFDGISDLIVGRMVDKTHSKLGKARVWLLRMCLPFALSVLLLFWVPQNFPQYFKYVYVFIMYNVVNTVCLTSMLVPYVTLPSLLTKVSYERSLLGNIQQIFSTLGNVFLNAVFIGMLTKFSDSAQTIYTQRSFTITTMIFCIIMVITSLITVISTKERVTDDVSAQTEKAKKPNVLASIKVLLTNRYWVVMMIGNFALFFVIACNSIGAIYFAQYVLNDANAYAWLANATSIAQFAIMFLTPLFMKKLPKHKLYNIGMVLLALGYLGFGLFGTSNLLMIICNALKGIGLGISGAMALGMVADAVEYGYLKTHVDVVGMGMSGMSAAQKLGMGLGTAVFGWVLSGSGFDASLDLQGIAQADTVIDAIKFINIWLPFILVLIISLVMIVFYRNIDKDMAALKEKQ